MSRAGQRTARLIITCPGDQSMIFGPHQRAVQFPARCTVGPVETVVAASSGVGAIDETGAATGPSDWL